MTIDSEPRHVAEPTPFTEDEQGVFRVLAAEHRAVDGMLERLETGEDRGDRRGLVEELTRELLSHARAEERTVYAALEEHGALAADVEEAFDEHGDIEHLLLAIDPGADDAEFVRQVTRLRGAVRHHVREEEEVLLRRAGRMIGLEESREMARAFRDEKRAGLADLADHVSGARDGAHDARV